MPKIILSILLMTAFGLSGCAKLSPAPTPTAFQLSQGPTAILPTAPHPTEIKPTNTLVMDTPWTPTIVPTATPLPGDVLALVAKVPSAEEVEVVLQGDDLNHIYTVRLIGVDAPRNNNATPWGIVAFNTVDKLLNGQVVRLLQDSTLQNEDGILPRYVYLGDTLVNRQLIEMGLADVAFFAPNTRLKSDFSAVAATASAKGIGIWGADPTATPTRTPTPNLTLTATPTLSATPVITVTPTLTATAPMTGTP